MVQYIDKTAVVEEIKRRIKIHHDYGHYNVEQEFTKILSFIDTLEVKEVDLDKTLTGFMGRYAYENGGEYPSAIEVAEHFFELGLKAQKGE